MPRYTLTTPAALTPEQVANILRHAASIDPKAEAPTLALVPRRLEVHGRRWFNRDKGHTYHSVRVRLDGKLIAHEPCRYGYGTQYSTTAVELLKDAGIIPADHPAKFAHKLGDLFDVAEEVEDVPRKRDL